MRFTLIFSILVCLNGLFDISCKKGSDVTIKVDTVLVRDTVTVYSQLVRTDKYYGRLWIDCFGGCPIETYDPAITEVSYYSNDSTNVRAYKGTVVNSAKMAYNFSIVKGKFVGSDFQSSWGFSFPRPDSVQFLVNGPLRGNSTLMYAYWGKMQ